ncbi:hypothetical protein Q7C_1069 [Methylophaga frappieri]|jgi:uncharacterized protein (TIGR02246 family)|uniref:DUF4440 domain-containing protein n=1 Tax=Methylophaga frappieri (strain ATCC BAA-2434 / DSM 25690 / JAM7) TaxID=754477 RepID=I1YH33_METFJ|nr:SgcJ/EcaC family oxidoreductase [Methylophaga frappieri]AFJ02226.1 hypothetical protein Q7C_1069 [Methylophaga frappieri]
MRSLFSLMATVGLVAFLSACSDKTTIDAQQVAQTANEDWNAAFNAADSEALSELYAEEATLSAGDGSVRNGQQEIATLFQSFFDNGLHNHQIETVATYVSGGQVSQLANWSADVNNEAGETMTYRGVLMTVLQQNADGEWQVGSHIWNMAP